MVKRIATAIVQLKLRLREDLRARLEAVAKRHDVSVNAEIVERLEKSFSDQDYLTEMQNQLGGPASYALLMIIGRAMHEAGTQAVCLAEAGKWDEKTVNNWRNYPYAYDQAARAAIYVLEALRPPGEAAPPRLEKEPTWGISLNEAAKQLGDGFARGALSDAANPEHDFGRRLRELLSASTGAKGK